ncbi:MAG: hypothetical protein ACKO37_01115 [Vampirovibrionales bacterium]
MMTLSSERMAQRPSESLPVTVPQGAALHVVKTPVQRIRPADTEQSKTLQAFQEEPLVSVWIVPDPHSDMMIPLSDGSIYQLCDTVTLNGIRFDLTPGENKLPRSVYEFLLQCPEQRHRVTTPQAGSNLCIGRIG